MRKFKIPLASLRNGLILSLALNLGLMVALAVKGRSPGRALSSRLAPKRELTNEGIIQFYLGLEMSDLIFELNQKGAAEEGVSCADIALGVLVTFHDFDLKRVLGNSLPEERTLIFTDSKTKKQQTLAVYPFLSSAQKEALFRFATSERWPLSSRGLFRALKKSKNAPASLKQAFYCTPEFQKLASLIPAAKPLILAALIESEWLDYVRLRFAIEREGLEKTLFEQAKKNRGGHTIELFLSTSFEYALKKLSDDEVVDLLRHIRLSSKAASLFAKQLLLSPRSERVYYLSAALLSKIYNKPLIEPFNRYRAVEVFFPELSGTGSM